MAVSIGNAPETASKGKTLHFSTTWTRYSKFCRLAITCVIPVSVARFARFLYTFGGTRGLAPYLRDLGLFHTQGSGARIVSQNSPKKEKRKWARLQLAIPVFVRAKDDSGKESLEFATAVNISAGGALVVVRRALAKSSPISLEIPSAPLGPSHGLSRSSRVIRARTIWVTHLNDYHLLGLKFARPLNTDGVAVPVSRLRKAGSAV